MIPFKVLTQFNDFKTHHLLKSPCHFFLSNHTTFSLCLSFSHLYSRSSSGSLMEVLKAVARQGSAASNSIAVRADRKSYSYSQIFLYSQRISNLLCASDLRSTLDGTKAVGSHGTRVGIVAKPSAEFLASVPGTWLSGRVAVPLALSYPEAELLHVMSDSDVSMVLSTEDHQELMQTVASKSAVQFSLIPSVPSTTDDGLSGTGGLDDSAEKTSGTRIKVEGPNVEEAGSTLPVMSFCIVCLCIMCMVFSMHYLLLFMRVPQLSLCQNFSVSGTWQRWRESYPKDGTKADNAVTVFTGVPTMYTRLIQGYEAMEPDVQAISASAGSKLCLMMCGSSALPYPVMRHWETITGHRLLERYGMTEFVMALSNPLHGLTKGGTVGKPLPGLEVKILAEDGSETTDVAPCCVGVLCIMLARQNLWGSSLWSNCVTGGDQEEKTGRDETCYNSRGTPDMGKREACSLQGE